MVLRSLTIIFRELIGKVPENYRVMNRGKRVLFLISVTSGLAIGIVIAWFLEHPTRGFGYGLIGLVIAFAIYNIVLIPVAVHRAEQRRARR